MHFRSFFAPLAGVISELTNKKDALWCIATCNFGSHAGARSPAPRRETCARQGNRPVEERRTNPEARECGVVSAGRRGFLASTSATYFEASTLGRGMWVETCRRGLRAVTGLCAPASAASVGPCGPTRRRADGGAARWRRGQMMNEMRPGQPVTVSFPWLR